MNFKKTIIFWHSYIKANYYFNWFLSFEKQNTSRTDIFDFLSLLLTQYYLKNL